MNGKPIAIFPVGKHTAMSGEEINVTPEILQEIATTYNPTLHEAPLVCGHPKDNSPAYGWAESLTVKDGLLYATPKQVNQDFAESVAQGAWKKRSASIYLPNTPGNPTPGKHYLRHIGFLGAQPPAIKGMPDINFSENDGAITLEFSEPTPNTNQPEGNDADIVPATTSEQPQQATPPPAGGGATVTTTEQPATMTDPNKATPQGANDEQAQKLKDKDAEIERLQTQLKQQEQAKQRKEALDYAEGLTKAGKLLPVQQSKVVELLLALPTEQPLEFSENGQAVSKPANQVLRELLDATPEIINFAEKSKADGEDLDNLTPQVLAKKARAYKAEQAKLGNEISITQAMNAITKGA
ncbi:peptidase [Entomomonas sp. E2T0]|uniref:peptidase n=1 Tax=Entomomonas sp. E2T0 TaxID=2930213 RepID=UPI00222827E2|nr:peptidase [Entomomonas sp. E2T0]UYZ84291.1 peptidase [Entomomonas sp. E2T0]